MNNNSVGAIIRSVQIVMTIIKSIISWKRHLFNLGKYYKFRFHETLKISYDS